MEMNVGLFLLGLFLGFLARHFMTKISFRVKRTTKGGPKGGGIW